MSQRSPINLRLRSKNVSSQHTATKSNESSKTNSFKLNSDNKGEILSTMRKSASKIPVNTSIKIGTQSNANIQRTLDHLENEMGEIKQNAIKFRDQCELRFNEIGTTIDSKCAQLDSFMELILRNQSSIHSQYIESNIVMPYNGGFNVKCNSVTSNDSIPSFDSLQSQCELLQDQINLLTDEHIEIATGFEKLLNNVNGQCVDLFVSANKVDGSELENCINRIEMLENSIKCLDEEIFKLNRSGMSGDEKISKMNMEIHVISAKYIDFNMRINRFLQDFKTKNSGNNSSINEHYKYVDADAISFATVENNVVTGDTSNGISNSTTTDSFGNDSPPLGSEFFCSAKICGQKFNDRIINSTYTHTLKMQINDVCVINLDSFGGKFIKTFNHFFGNEIAMNVTISKCTISNGIVGQIQLYIHLRVPLNYEYMGNMHFPDNWIIIPKSFHSTHRFRKVFTKY